MFVSRILLIAAAMVGPRAVVADENAAVPDAGVAPSPIELFEQRIMPIFKSPKPASCVQCHLASVDLKDYIRPSHQQTFVSLRDQGLIDLQHPDQSKILTLIRMGEKDLDKGAKLIHEDTRNAELTAFAAWIEACCADPGLRDLPPLDAADVAKPDRPDEVIRFTRKDRVVDSFARNIWSQRMRCFPCHTPHELDESNPKLRPAIAKHKEFLAEYGEQFGQRMKLFGATPEESLQLLLARSREPKEGELPLINLQDPVRSLLVLKPTAKLPAKGADGKFEAPGYAEPVSHMGGLKMHPDDQSYKSFVAWIEDYANVVGDHYSTAEDLPADNWHASKRAIVLRQVPEDWAVKTRVQLVVHAWNNESGSWSERPAAFTQGTVTPVRNVAGTLFILGYGSETKGATLDGENSTLAPGKYLVKAYVDSHDRLAKDPTLMLGDDDYYGELELDANWREGFPLAEKPLGSQLKKR